MLNMTAIHICLFLGLSLLSRVSHCSNRSTYCSGIQNISNSAGEIASHSGAGSSAYLKNMNCTWIIRAPEGKRIVAWFTLIDLVSSHDDIRYRVNDRVTLYDRNSAEVMTNVSSIFSPGYVSPTYVSTSNAMTIWFSANSGFTRTGFRLQYEVRTVTVSDRCGSIKYSDRSNTSGVLTSHEGYDGLTVLYGPKRNCTWQLTGLPGQETHVSVTLVNMSLAPGDNFSIASLTASKRRLRKVSFHGQAARDLTFAPSSHIYITFLSNWKFESFGFLIRFFHYKFFNLTSDSGEIVSHSGVGVTPYSNTTSSTWLITAPPGNQVDVLLTYCSLNSLPDSLTLYDEVADWTVAHMNGYNCSVRAFQSQSNILRVTFRTESSGTGLGFRMMYNTTQEAQFCSGSVELTAESGEIASHKGAGSVKYLDNMNCTWVIKAPEVRIIVTWFTLFELEPPGYNGMTDKVSLYDGTSTDEKMMILSARRLRWFRMWPKIISRSNFLTVQFQTYSWFRHMSYGFRLRYEFRKPLNHSICGLFRFSDVYSTSGELASHEGYDGFTPPPGNLTCEWNLRSHKTNMSITFVNVSLANGDCLSVRASRGFLVLVNVCGWKASNNITLNPATNVKVRYSSVGKYKSAGFLLRFRSEAIGPQKPEFTTATTLVSEASTTASEASTAASEASTAASEASTAASEGSTPTTKPPVTTQKPHLMRYILNSCVRSLNSCAQILNSCATSLGSCVGSSKRKPNAHPRRQRNKRKRWQY